MRLIYTTLTKEDRMRDYEDSINNRRDRPKRRRRDSG